MRYLLAIVLCIAATALPAAQRVYEGREAAAIRCANTVALTAVALSSVSLIDAVEKDVMLGISVSMLERHVSGTWNEKKAAMAVMRDRRSVDDTIDDYRRNAARCLAQFPIN